MFIKLFKSIGAAIVIGAGMEFGTILARKGAQIAEDPVKKAKIKRKFNTIKETIFKKEEEES
jgi:hypothetical protein